MKFIAILIIAFGFVGFIALTSFEASLPLVQFVRKDEVITTPVHTMLPPGTQFIAGQGTNGAKFVDINSDAAKYIELPRYLWLAKLGCFGVCAMGAIGFGFELSRERAKRIYALTPLGQDESSIEANSRT